MRGAVVVPESRAQRWVDDDCEKGWIWPLYRKYAEGVLKIHATCDPPCPRKQRAAAYLDDLEAGRVQDDPPFRADWRAAR